MVAPNCKQLPVCCRVFFPPSGINSPFPTSHEKSANFFKAVGLLKPGFTGSNIPPNFPVLVMLPCDVRVWVASLPTQLKLNASPVRRKQKAGPFEREGRGGCATEACEEASELLV